MSRRETEKRQVPIGKSPSGTSISDVTYCQHSWHLCRLIPSSLSNLIGSHVQSWKGWQRLCAYINVCVCARSISRLVHFHFVAVVDRSYNDHFWRRVVRQPALLGIVIGDKFSVGWLTDIGVLFVLVHAYKLWPLCECSSLRFPSIIW